MVKQAPNLPKLLTMVIFALSCFGLLAFLWLSFGGPVPLQPKGYRFEVDFPEAVSLADEADVRISGVNVGKVVALDRHIGRTRATIQLDPRYAPIPRSSKAILRSKTLLGETYVALSPGRRGGRPVPDGGALPDRNVVDQVQLDEVLRAFDKPTRAALGRWLREMAATFRGRGPDLSNALGELAPTAQQGAGLLAILDAQHAAVRRLVSDTGRVFGAVGAQAGAVQALVRAGDRLFATTAARRDALSRTIAALPGFMAQTRATLRTARAAATDARPAIDALQPVAPLLGPALRETSRLAPKARRLLERLAPVISRSRTALPAASHLLDQAQPLVARLLPVAEDLAPSVRYLHGQQDQVAAAAANVAAAVEAALPAPTGGPPLHYLRAVVYLSQEGLMGVKRRLASNRHNAYLRDGGLRDLGHPAIHAIDCANTSDPQPVPPPKPPPPCVVQRPYAAFGGGAYPHVTRDTP